MKSSKLAPTKLMKIQSNYPINSSPASAAYTRRWTTLVLVQVMACRLFGAKSLHEPVLPMFNLYLRNNLQWNLNLKKINSCKCTWKCRLRDGGHFVQGGDKLKPCLLALSSLSIQIWNACRFGKGVAYSIEGNIMIWNNIWTSKCG